MDAGATENTAGAADRRWTLRPMEVGDVDAAMAVIQEADAEQVRQGGHPERAAPTPEQIESSRRGHTRFVTRDGPGAWVAVAGDQVQGVAESIRREDFWGLSMLFVHPDFQSEGVGRELLGAALGYGAGARVRMIQSSPDPRAMRRYALAGLAMHPAADVYGTPERSAIPRILLGRTGEEGDLELVATVEAAIGRSRTEDVAFGIESGNRFDVVDEGDRRGWMLWNASRLVMLGATDEETAATLLWRFIAGVEGEALAYGLTAGQNWAFSVCHAARLRLRVSGAMFVDGMDQLPRPWIPSGWYF